MPFKIMKTYFEQQNKQELCICPSKWEKYNVKQMIQLHNPTGLKYFSLELELK